MNSFFSKNVLSESVVKYYDVVSDFIRTHRTACYYGTGAVLATVISYKLGQDVRQRIFVWMNSKADLIKDKKYDEYRIQLCEPLKMLKSHDPELAEEKSIKILEIGVGCGTNFKYYPKGSHLVLVDPNPHFREYFTSRLTDDLKVKDDDIIISRGEDMDEVPSESVDAVVVTLVLCSVSDVTKVVEQAKRVLVPGGKFLFMEHVYEWDTKLWKRRFFQLLLTFTRVWPFLFEGCSLNRDPVPIIRAAGFSQVEHKYFYASFQWKIFSVCSPHVLGAATK